MRSIRPIFRNLRRHQGAVPLAVILGTSLGMFVHGYWPRNLLPPGSVLLLISAVAAASSAALYLHLLGWLRRSLAALSLRGLAGTGALALLLAVFAFYGGTSGWQGTVRYLTFLLPRHELRLSAASSEQPAGIALIWFSTSLGDVPYGTIDAVGWKRQGDELVLENAPGNSLRWVGPTGSTAQIVLRSAQAGSSVAVTWDGLEESVRLPEGKTTLVRPLKVPFYASAAFVAGLGLVNFAVLSLALVLLLRESRSTWMPPLVSSVPGSRPRIDRADFALLGGAIILALLLRAVRLSALFPAVDEYYHLLAAQQIVQGAGVDAVYPRSLWLVTLPVSLALRWFGHEIWAVRLVGVLFNVLAVIPLYLIGRRINRPVAALSVLLCAISPWIITFARVAREYAYYPFYFYWIVLAMITVVEAIPAGCVVLRDWRPLLAPRVLILGALLVLPPIFALSVDWLSTFRTILIAYLVFGLFMLARFNWRDRRNWLPLGIVAVGLLAIGRDWYQEQGDKLLMLPQLNALPVSYFLPNPQQQWYVDRAVVLVVLGIAAAVLLAVATRRSSSVPMFILVLFGGYLAVFAFLSRTFFHTRHLLTTQFWYVIVLAMGMHAIWTLLRALLPWKSKLAGVLLAVLLGLSVSNLRQILLPSFSSDPDMPISEDYLHDLSGVQAYMLDHAQASDVLISTVYGLYAAWEGQPAFKAQYRISTQTPLDRIDSIVDLYPSGWIIIDKIRLDLSSLSPRDLTRNPQIEYIGTFGDEYVWRWRHSSSSLGAPAAAEP